MKLSNDALAAIADGWVAYTNNARNERRPIEFLTARNAPYHPHFTCTYDRQAYLTNEAKYRLEAYVQNNVNDFRKTGREQMELIKSGDINKTCWKPRSSTFQQ